MQSPRKLKDWEVAWGLGFSSLGGVCVLMVPASLGEGDLPVALWLLGTAVICALGAWVAFTPSRRTKRAPGTEHPYCTGCGDRHDGPRCY
jgi:hypothetical protein